MENLMNSSNPKEDQQTKSDDSTMSLIRKLYANRELMPMQAEPDEPMLEAEDGTTTT